MEKKNDSLFSKNIILVLAASFFYMASPMLVTPLITGFAGTIGANGTVMGIVGGAMNFCSLICRPLMGNLTDKMTKYRLSFIGACFLFVSSLGYVFVGNVPLLLILRILNGVGFSCCSVCLSTWVSQLLPKNKIGAGMGLYGTMNALSMAIAPAVGVALRNAYNIRISFIAAVIFACLCMITVQFVSDKGEPAHAQNEKNGKLQILDINVLPITFTTMFFAIPYCATQSFIVNYVESRALNVTVGLFFPAYAVFLLILRFSLKSLFDKLPFMTFMTIGNAGALCSMLLLWKMDNDLMLIAAAFFMAVGYGTMCTVCQSNAILIAGEGKRGLANSTYLIGLDLGMTLGPVLGGIVFGHVPHESFYPVFMADVPLCFVVYMISKVMIGKKKAQ